MSMTFPLGAAAVTQQPDAGEPLIRWDWLARHLDDIAVRTFEHIQLTAIAVGVGLVVSCLLYTSPSPRDRTRSRMPSSA